MAGKTFKENLNNINPAMQFISPLESDTPPLKAKQVIAPVPDRHHSETKSRRVQLLVQPSLYEKALTEAKSSGKSVNDFIHSLLEAALN